MESTNSGASVELLVIGYGNTLRGDDSVGPRVVEAIEKSRLRGVSALSCTLLTPELAATVAEARRVVFVDATLEGTTAVELRAILPAQSIQVLGHSASPEMLLGLARDMFGHSPEAWILAIPVENMEVGEELSGLARKGVDIAIEKIREMARCLG
jgi:hydrogenase maturation protease